MWRAKSCAARPARSSHGWTSLLGLGVARRQRQVPGSTTPSSCWRREPLLAQLRPSRRRSGPRYLAMSSGSGVQRRVHRAVREVEEERLGRVRRLALADHRDRPVGEVVGEVVVVGVAVDLDEVVVLDEAVRLVQVRERVEDAVEAVEAALARPRVLRPRGGAVGVLGEVPLPHHQRRVPLVAQELGDAWRRRSSAPSRSPGKPGSTCATVPSAGEVRVQAGEQRRPRRRAHRRRVEVGEAEAA